MKHYDLAVVGAGLAGAAAAKMAAEEGLSVLLLEKGKPLKSRRDPACGWFGTFPNTCCKLPDERPGLLPSQDIARAVEAFGSIGRLSRQHARRGELGGLPLRPFDLHQAGPSLGHSMARSSHAMMPSGCDMLFGVEAVRVAAGPQGFSLSSSRGSFEAGSCLVASGSGSAEWVKRLCDEHGLDWTEPAIRLGGRVELPARMLKGALDGHCDLRLDHGNAWSDDFWANGLVGEWDDFGFVSAFGHRPPSKRSERTNFLVSTPFDAGVEEALRLIRIVNVLANDKVKKERVFDFMRGGTVLQHFERHYSGLVGAMSDWRAAIPRFIESAVIHVPEIRMEGAFPVDEHMRTSVRGLYGAGRCTTRATTSVGALASAHVAVRSIMEDKEKR